MRIEAAHSIHPQEAASVSSWMIVASSQPKRSVDKATDDFERIKQRSEAKTAAWHAASGALANAETWLRHGKPSGVQLLDWDGPRAEVAQGRGRTARCHREPAAACAASCAPICIAIQSAPYPVELLQGADARDGRALAMRGAPKVSLLIEHDRRD